MCVCGLLCVSLLCVCVIVWIVLCECVDCCVCVWIVVCVCLSVDCSV